MLKVHRLSYHALVARWLEHAAEQSSRLDQYAGLIAGHYDRAGDHTAAARWYLRAGHQATGVDAMREATGLLTRALELVPDTDPELQFDLHLAREVVYERLGERDLQQAALAELERLAPGIDDPGRTVQLLLRQGQWAFNASDFTAQVAAARQAIDRARAAGLAVIEVEAQVLCGQGLAWDSQHAAANEVLEEALAGARATGRPWLIGESIRYMAIVAGNQGDFDRSIELLEEARAVHRDADEPDGEGLVLAQMASTLFNQGRYREARTYLEQALPIFTASGYKYRQAVAIGNLGTIVVMEGEFGTARRLLMEGLRLSTEVRDGEGTGLTHGMLGELYRRVGDLDRAESYLREALATAEQVDYESLASDVLVSQALVAVERGHFEPAARLADEALVHARRGGASLYEARALLARGAALTAAERLADAEADLQACLALADEMGVSNLVVEAVAGLALTAFRRGDLESAVALVDGVVDQLEPADVLGCLQPGEVYRTCWQVLLAGDDPRAAARAPRRRRLSGRDRRADRRGRSAGGLLTRSSRERGVGPGPPRAGRLTSIRDASGEGIAMHGPRRVWTRVAVVVALLVGIQGDTGAGSSRPGDLLPDLQMARLYGMDLKTTRGGRIRLHFGTIGWNLGDGPIEARGRRNAQGDLVMRVIQRIYRSAGGFRDRVTPAVMIYETGDHHDHWHVRQFTVVQMYRRGAPGGSVYGLRKIGYCLLDARRIATPPAHSPDERVYRSDACGSRASRQVRTGLSVGYGDDYPPDYAHQWMDITGLAPGVYRICTTIDPLDEFVEKNERNNQRWTDVRINTGTGTVTTLATAIAACGPHVT